MKTQRRLGDAPDHLATFNSPHVWAGVQVRRTFIYFTGIQQKLESAATGKTLRQPTCTLESLQSMKPLPGIVCVAELVVNGFDGTQGPVSVILRWGHRTDCQFATIRPPTRTRSHNRTTRLSPATKKLKMHGSKRPLLGSCHEGYLNCNSSNAYQIILYHTIFYHMILYSIIPYSSKSQGHGAPAEPAAQAWMKPRTWHSALASSRTLGGMLQALAVFINWGSLLRVSFEKEPYYLRVYIRAAAVYEIPIDLGACAWLLPSQGLTGCTTILK